MRGKLALSILGILGGVGLGASLAKRRRGGYSFRGRSVLITGGSRGLGLVMARRLARAGARLTLVARRQEDLARAEQQLRGYGAEVLSVACDLTRQEQVNGAVTRAAMRYGGIDVLINNAGIIQVGPFEHMTVQDFQEAMAIHLYAPLFAIMAVLPHMRLGGGGRIVNISSIGGKIALPHLLPYVASKFALVGLSDGLRAELRRDNIFVTTVCPGLMRTGSPRNALFKGQHRKEYAWFAVSDSLPVLSVSAEQAAQQILLACARGSARLILGTHAKAAFLLSELFPGAHATLASLANRCLPAPDPSASERSFHGHESESAWVPSWLTRLSQRAALRNNQVA